MSTYDVGNVEGNIDVVRNCRILVQVQYLLRIGQLLCAVCSK